MALKPLDPTVEEPLCPDWTIAAVESGRGTAGLKANLLLTNGVPQHYRVLDLGDEDAQQALATIYARKTGLDEAAILKVLLKLIVNIEGATRERDKQRRPVPQEYDYDEDGAGLWLVTHAPQGDERVQLTNFGATITADVVEDDGTPETRRFFEVEAHYGEAYAEVRVAAKEFHALGWVPETLGAKARVYPGPWRKEHAVAAIQDRSDAIETRHTYVHTGWRYLQDRWQYLHGAGAIHAEGATTDILVTLAPALARYELPVPPIGEACATALCASLAVAAVAPSGAMIPLLATTYLAPLCPFLDGEPPDFTTWVAGASGQFKSEYAALALAHHGDFTRLTLPASFVATGNGLERLCHTLKDCLLVVDDFYPAGDRRQAEAMQQTAGRLLRSMGNRSARQRMQHDTTMRSDLPPRCLVIATGERLPEGLSTNARTFLVTVPKLSDADKQPWADKLSHAQADRDQLPLAMAAYLQWIAVHWETLEKDVPARFHALRTAAYQDGSHTREPGQVAYLQLAWEMFTRCAVDAGVLSTDFQQAILDETQAYLSGLAGEHSQILHDDTTVSRFLALLGDGFASKQIYLRTPRDTAPMDAGDWGWTEEEEYDRKTDSKALVPRAHQATLVGYLDGEYIYLLPDAIYRYLQHASQKAGRTWPVDSTTFQRELDDAGLILTVVDKKRTYRQKNKKVNGKAIRCVWVNREALRLMMGEATEREPGEEDERIPF